MFQSSLPKDGTQEQGLVMTGPQQTPELLKVLLTTILSMPETRVDDASVQLMKKYPSLLNKLSDAIQQQRIESS